MITSKIYTPLPWQVPMGDHLAEHKRCALWAGMGTGKTVVVLTFLDFLFLAEGPVPTLVLGPLRVARSVWGDEALKWDHLKHLKVVPIVGTAKERVKAVLQKGDIYTVNYESLVWLIEYWGEQWPYKVVVADESDYIKSHRMAFKTAKKKDGTKGKTFISGQGAKRAAALAKIAFTHIDRFIELTGTPAPNGLQDLWGQVWFLDRGHRLGRTFSAFSERWFRVGYNGSGLRPMPHTDSEIHNAVKDLCLTINGTDWFSLDEPVVNTVAVDLPLVAQAVYDEVERMMFYEFQNGGVVDAANAAVKTSKCLQIANGAVYTTPAPGDEPEKGAPEWEVIHDAKLSALKSVVTEACGAPLIVCYEFRSDKARLRKAFPKGRVLESKKDEEDFKKGKVPILFVHPKSAGHGIDGFQYVCNHIVFFGHNWSLGQYLQVIERIGPVRQMQAGLKRPVYITHIITKGTVDELVMERRDGKKSVQDILLAACARHMRKEKASC